jgi:hypothetical protein
MREAAATPAAAIPVATPLATPVVAAETPLPITPTAVATSQAPIDTALIEVGGLGPPLINLREAEPPPPEALPKATRIPSFSSNDPSMVILKC